MNRRDSDNLVRIIGGKWRGRKISFSPRSNIRPTPDRVRETLFNWLQPEISGARCLELYSGSGILSLEALSRGAASVTLVERSIAVVRHLNSTFDELQIPPDTYEINCRSALDYLETHPPNNPYDIVFLDPPFDTDQLSVVRRLLPGVVHERSFVYVETDQSLDTFPGFLPYRSKRAGKVYYHLYQPISGNSG